MQPKMMRNRVLMYSLLTATATGVSACTRTIQSTETSIPGETAPSVRGDAPDAVGAVTGKAAVEGFLKAVKAQDLQTMSAIWGTTKGAARDQMKREDLEKRLIIMQCTLTHDRWALLEDRPRLQTGGRQEFQLEFFQGPRSAKTSILTVNGPGGRWFVEDINLLPLKDFCR
ncbi:hypothetical protein [Gemmatimonas groenlandica]|uniref:DUF4019 domain-containing protein n=1 Tax=Gemmatimonas groenlandica TaxID=2732249 RepID=A0A6M4IRK3_9BACT|nr:hypothetical protein [Gemmatimonas groenlandica]QJR35472.1 hypothetical protein HKW67_08115 [Gemmatimonas groenlandica]